MPKEAINDCKSEMSDVVSDTFKKSGDAWINFIEEVNKLVPQGGMYDNARARMSNGINEALSKLTRDQEDEIFQIRKDDPWERSCFDAYLDERIADFVIEKKVSVSDYTALLEYIDDRSYWRDFFEKYKKELN